MNARCTECSKLNNFSATRGSKLKDSCCRFCKKNKLELVSFSHLFGNNSIYKNKAGDYFTLDRSTGLLVWGMNNFDYQKTV
jgi:hypothetical protein